MRFAKYFLLYLITASLALPINAQGASSAPAKPAASKPAPVQVEKTIPPLKSDAADSGKSDAAGAEPAPEAPGEKESPFPPGPSGDAARAYSKGDINTARKIWEELAANGDAQAMNNLGALYDQGAGVEPDTGRAFHWFAASANAGNPSGMNNYGRMLEQGRGAPANAEEAARWFDKAARQGQPEAQYNLGYLYENGRGVPMDEKAAAAWYSRAASMRQKDALARLGHFYRTGKGVEKNEQRGALLLYAAAMEGSSAAIQELEDMARDNPPKGSANLFGLKLDETNRQSLRNSLQKMAASSKREDNSHICDVYDVAKVIPGAGEMAACYGPSGRLGFLKIDYAADDKSRAEAVLKMVESRFGPPTAGEGEDARIWNLGPVIVATQYAPTHRQISLMYMVPKVYYQTKGKNN